MQPDSRISLEYGLSLFAIPLLAILFHVLLEADGLVLAGTGAAFTAVSIRCIHRYRRLKAVRFRALAAAEQKMLASAMVLGIAGVLGFLAGMVQMIRR